MAAVDCAAYMPPEFFDYCRDENILFDLCIDVSAGSANVASYIAGQEKRNYCTFLLPFLS